MVFLRGCVSLPSCGPTQEDANTSSSLSRALCWSTSASEAPKPPLFIRYYEEEEFAAQRRRIVMRNRGFPINEYDIDDMGGMWRIRRLWKSVVGFYKVRRHERPTVFNLFLQSSHTLRRESWTSRVGASDGGDR